MKTQHSQKLINWLIKKKKKKNCADVQDWDAIVAENRKLFGKCKNILKSLVTSH